MGGIPVADGKKLRCGKVIRSGRLSKLPEETVKALEELDIDNIIDLRTPREIAENPPTILKGVEYHYLTLIPTAPPEQTAAKHMSTEMYAQSKRVKKDFGTYENFMHAMYSYIAFEEQSKATLKKIFDLIAAEERCILFHCNSGTDRTGIIAMLLLSVLGADRQTIIDDYMLSYRLQRRRRYWQKFGLICSPISLKFKHLLYAQMLPKPQYISQLMDEIEEKYGTISDYMKNGLGMTEEQLLAIKDKYLE